MLNLNTNWVSDIIKTLQQWWPIVKSNFQAIQTAFNDHISGIGERHNAQGIDYTGNMPGDNVKSALDNHIGAVEDSRHNAEDIDYSGIATGSNVKAAIDAMKGEIQNLSFTGAEHDPLVTGSLIDTEGDNFGQVGNATYLNGRLNKWEGKSKNLEADFESHLSDNMAHASKFEKGTAATMTYNFTPRDAKILRIYHGDDTTPTTDGTTPSVFIQRVDQSVTADDPGHLIPALYTTIKRKAGGTGWLYTNLNYLEDESDTGNSQGVAVAGMAYARNKAKVWGVYGDAYSYSTLATITGGEFNAQNMSGADYEYNQASPTGSPFSCAIWAISFGTKHNSFGIGIGGGGSSLWGCGLFLQVNSIKNIGIDIQAQPPTAIKLHGASNDGKGSIPGGIGIDAGVGAFYGQGVNQGFLHVRDADICWGASGLLKTRMNESLGHLEFWFNGILVGHLDCAGADHAI